jgi:MtN3 and saliva related transmembrane protein
MMFEDVGYIAAFLTTVAFLPQALQTIKTRNTESLSLSMYGLFTAGVFCWLLYGFVLDDYAIILANVITLLLALSIFSIKLINVMKGRDKP